MYCIYSGCSICDQTLYFSWFKIDFGGVVRSKKPCNLNYKAFDFFVPGTGLEPAHPCERCDLNTVRLPISPPGHFN